MTKAEQLKMIDGLEKKLKDALEELAVLKESLLDNPSSTASTDTNGITLEDVYAAIGKRKKSYAYRLRTFCKEKNIDTLEEFLHIPPSEFINAKGIGITTLHIIRKSIEGLGIVWTDAQ